MIRKVRRCIFAGIVLVCLIMGSCATRPFVQKEKSILALVRAINNGEAAQRSLAETPFLFNGEIILLQNHLTILWDNLYKAGFRMEDVSIVRNELLRENSWSEFGDTMDVRTFFSKYLDRNTSLVEIRARSGNYIFLLNTEVRGYPRIQGFKGGG